MSLTENNENNSLDNNKILFVKLFEKISNNYILKYEYMFFGILLKEWYSSNQKILEDKVDNLKDAYSIYVYNCYKIILYNIMNIFYKNKVYYYFDFIKNLKNKLLKKKIVIQISEDIRKKTLIKNINIELFGQILKTKFLNITIKNEKLNSFYTENNKHTTIIKNIFLDKVIYANIKILKNKNGNIKLYLKRKNSNYNNVENKIIITNCKYISYIKWKIYTFKNSIKLYNFYFSKIKFFQINNFIYIYKRKLKTLYNIFKSNCEKYLSSNFNINEKNKMIKNNIIALFQPLSNIFSTKKSNIYYFFIFFYYSISKDMIFLHSIYYLINKLLIRYKNNFLFILKKNNNKIKYNSILMKMTLLNILSFNKMKLCYIFFNSLKSKIKNESNYKNQIKNINIKINNNSHYYKNINTLIKVISIYSKNLTLKKITKEQLKKYFIKWKLKVKKYIYNNLIKNKYLIRKKIAKYSKGNKIMQNKLLKIKKIIEKNKMKKDINKKKFNKNYLNNSNKIKNYLMPNNEKKKKEENLMEKIMISESKTIDSNEFDNYFDELPQNYLDNLESLKNKNEPIIANLQSQINVLINEIDILSNN